MTEQERAALTEIVTGLIVAGVEARRVAADVSPGSPAWSRACALAAEAGREAEDVLADLGMPLVFARDLEGRA